MNKTILRLATLLTMLAVSTTAAFSASYDFAKSTPVGSWQLRQEITLDEKGKGQLMEIKTSMVGEEKRADVDYVWIELAMNSFKYKNGKKGAAAGETTLVKILIEKAMLKGNPEDIVNNLRGMGKEIIMQQGDADPMKIEEGGMLGGALMQALGMEVDYQFNESGSEKVETAAGSYKCKVVEGTGSVTAKILFKTIKVDSTVKQWLCNDVPFGIVKSETSSTTDGKTSTTSAILLDSGMKGAVSQIKGEAQSLSVPGLSDLFGR